ncbi:hypothetical protein JWJ90_03245 [Desulfobulbus rhabdoformis]|uniref:hypothetical protein n=1 Tax=Desulfobulbus rhabdoformis TaxID=34032 RepID=UPI001964B939|nr:hypothetical protein [Desulfobulbus rhabdoformis]MBM9613297.1 hypothetical protein [Desulfobulbus rhabdoformis]
MNKTWQQTTRHKVSLQRRILGILACAVFCSLMALGAPQVQAVEQTSDSAAIARKLQLEGAKLQLQGNLAGAVEKYRESVALKPNPKLEDLIERLEPKVDGQKAETAVAPATDPAAPKPSPNIPSSVKVDTPEGQDPPVQVLTPPELDSSGAPVPPIAVTPPVVPRIPAGPEEELIYAFTDWFIHLFPAEDPEGDFSLQTNRQYTITKVGPEYEVVLDPFTLLIDNDDTLALGPLKFRLQPEGPDLLAVRMQLASSAPITSRGKEEALLTIGSQDFSALWNRQLMNFDAFDVNLGELAIEDVEKTGRLSLAQLIAKGGRTEQESGNWTEDIHCALKQLAFVEKTANFGIDSIEGQVVASGTNAKRFLELRTSMQEVLGRLDELSMEELKPLMGDIDEYMQLFNGYTSSADLKNFHLSSRDGVATLASITMRGGVEKEAATGKFIYSSDGQFNDFTFNENSSGKKQNPVSVVLHKIGLKGDGAMDALPPNLFAEIFAGVEEYQKLDPNEADKFAAERGYALGKKILSLFQRYSGEVSVHELLVANALPTPISLDKASVGAGFDVGDGQGGTIHTLVDYSGLKGLPLPPNSVPDAGRVHLELSQIPNLLNLISDPASLAQGNMDAIQGQVMMNGMGALMQSGLTLNLSDTFVNFPATKITLALLAKVNPSSQYMSTGTLNLALENPEELKRVLQTYSQDPGIEQAFGMLTALANRTEEGGKTVDRIDAKLDPQGKVIINGKDVTSMFFPEQAASGQGAAPAK